MYTKKIIYFVSFLLTGFNWAQNVAPVLTATGNQVYCPKSQINIVTDFNIVDPDDTEMAVLNIQISQGYVQGEDLLILTGLHSTINTSWNPSQGKLSLYSSTTTTASIVDLIAATKDVVFESTSDNPVNKTFSLTIDDANYLPSTDHYYQFVPQLGITWSDARLAAENRTYFGLKGYLATITTPEEAQLSGEQASGAGWLGGTDQETEGVWKWVTGPEAGTIFWNGLSNGSAPNNAYANWNIGEPNQSGDEDYVHVTAPGIGSPGSWNDLPNAGANSGPYQPKGYIVEYGGTPGDPVLYISTSSRIYTNAITNTVPATICGSGSVNLEATASQGDVMWFDSLTASTPLFTGTVFTTPNVSSTTTYYALASLNGCVTGNRIPVTVSVLQLPVINTVTNDSVCESGSGTLSVAASAGTINWYDTQTGGTSINSGSTYITPIVNSTTTYYVDTTLNGCTSTRTPVTLTVNYIPTPTTVNPNQTFCDTEQAIISNLSVLGSDLQWYTTSSGGIPVTDTDLLTTKTYYVSQTITGCESSNRLPIQVTVYETVVLPDASTIPNLAECDTDLDGDDSNGFTTFDLTQNESILLNGKSNSNFTFQYFTDATYTTLIATPSNSFYNTIINGQTIYVRIVNNLNYACYTDTSFNIVVYPLPNILNSIILKNCDEDGIADGFTDFNLNEANQIITNNASNYTITYYLSLTHANSEISNIAAIFNNQTANTVYARVENSDGCYRITTINLQVSTTSFNPNYIKELQSCDDDNVIDGLHVFDLTQASNELIAQFPTGQNLSVLYFENLRDAQLNQNTIIQPESYTNNIPFSQTLYVRVQSNDNNACFGIGPHLLLTVNPRPEFEVDNSEMFCLDSNNPITLTTFNPRGNYTYEWKNTNGDIVSQQDYAMVNSGGSYTVVATSSFGCESFPNTFVVVESAIAQIVTDDITIVELSNNNSITINNSNNNLGIGDYEFALNNQNGPYQNDAFFENIPAGSHLLFVRDKNGCGITSIEFFILGFPAFFTPNSDGFNDFWQIKGLGSDFTNESKVTIFNRYGKLLKQINAKNEAWDGTFNGISLPNSDYWFVAELVDIEGNIKIYKGHFAIVR